MEYLINVALSFTPQLVFGLVVWAIASEVMKRTEKFKDRKNYKDNRYYLFFFLAVSLVLSMSSPSITYKHQPFDSAQESYQIEMLNDQKHEQLGLVIEDRTRKDHSVSQEEWDAQSSYKKGLDDE